jgi:DNA-binding transcriptional LysR family regulator
MAGQSDAGLARLVSRIFDKGGFIPLVAQTVSQIAAAIVLVEAGLGVSLVLESLAAMQVGTVTYRHLSEVEDVSEVALVVMTNNRSPLTLSFVESAAATSNFRSGAG